MPDTAAYNAALALAAGVAAVTVADRLAIPSIVLLLLTGVAIGPDGLSLLSPSALGSGRGDLVTLGVAIILFEGALGLRLGDLRLQQRPLLLLLTVGGVLSMATGAVAAHALLDVSWTTAVLYGALVIVTGPTVVTPLMSRLTVSRPVRELLVSEGVLIDPLGAIAALVVLEYAIGQQGAWSAAGALVTRLGIGAAVGTAAGALAAVALRRGWVPDDLWNPVVLASALITGAVASRLSPEAGLMAVVAQGIAMANSGLRQVQQLRRFNEEITVLLLAFLFVMLAADLPLREVAALGWRGLAVVAILLWVARPLSVLICTAGSALSVRERLFIAWICPRGIVAASVAGLFRIRLDAAGARGGTELEALIFVTVALSVTLQGLTAGAVARRLGIDLEAARGTLIVGAGPFGRLLARTLSVSDRQVALVDRSSAMCRQALREELTVYRGDALAPETLEDAGARYADTLLAATSNVELNVLIADTARREFRVPRALAVDEPARREGTDHPFPGAFPGVEEIEHQLHVGGVQLEAYEAEAGWTAAPLGDLPYGPAAFALRLDHAGWSFVASASQTIAAGDRLVCARWGAGPPALAAVPGLRLVDVA